MAVTVDALHQGRASKMWSGGRPPAWLPVTRRFGRGMGRPRGVAGSELKHYRWHCLRRGGATQLWASGARNQIVMLAGGWETPSVARHYTKPKHALNFMARREQPVPVCGDSGNRLVYGDWPSKQWWPAWLRKELRVLAAEPRTNGDVLAPAGQAARKRRLTRSAGSPGAE